MFKVGDIKEWILRITAFMCKTQTPLRPKQRRCNLIVPIIYAPITSRVVSYEPLKAGSIEILDKYALRYIDYHAKRYATTTMKMIYRFEIPP
jgi:hypothetical protein